MDQDLDQILLLIGCVLAAGFVLIFVLAWLEPVRTIGDEPLAAPEPEVLGAEATT